MFNIHPLLWTYRALELSINPLSLEWRMEWGRAGGRTRKWRVLERASLRERLVKCVTSGSLRQVTSIHSLFWQHFEVMTWSNDEPKTNTFMSLGRPFHSYILVPLLQNFLCRGHFWSYCKPNILKWGRSSFITRSAHQFAAPRTLGPHPSSFFSTSDAIRLKFRLQPPKNAIKP